MKLLPEAATAGLIPSIAIDALLAKATPHKGLLLKRKKAGQALAGGRRKNLLFDFYRWSVVRRLRELGDRHRDQTIIELRHRLPAYRPERVWLAGGQDDDF